MTFQVGAVGRDGVVIASDQQLINEHGSFRTTERAQKIKITFPKEDQSVMYCWSGDECPGE